MGLKDVTLKGKGRGRHGDTHGYTFAIAQSEGWYISTLKVVRSRIVKLGKLIEKMLSEEGKRTVQLIWHWKSHIIWWQSDHGAKAYCKPWSCMYSPVNNAWHSTPGLQHAQGTKGHEARQKTIDLMDNMNPNSIEKKDLCNLFKATDKILLSRPLRENAYWLDINHPCW